MMLNPANIKLLDAFCKKLQGSVLIQAQYVADIDVSLEYLLNKLYSDPKLHLSYVYYLKDNNLESLKNLLETLNHTRFEQTIPRLIIIKNCHNINMVMQNTLLKSLEEPPIGSHFILTADSNNDLAPTIISRCQVIKLKKPLKADVFKHYNQVDEKLLNQAYLACDGWPTVMEEYLNNPSSLIHQEINLAKQFLTLKPDQRLKLLLGKNSNPEKLRQNLELIINGLWRICRGAVLTESNLNQASKIQAWQQKLILADQLKIDLDNRINHKLLAIQLSLRL